MGTAKIVVLTAPAEKPRADSGGSHIALLEPRETTDTLLERIWAQPRLMVKAISGLLAQGRAEDALDRFDDSHMLSRAMLLDVVQETPGLRLAEVDRAIEDGEIETSRDGDAVRVDSLRAWLENWLAHNVGRLDYVPAWDRKPTAHDKLYHEG